MLLKQVERTRPLRRRPVSIRAMSSPHSNDPNEVAIPSRQSRKSFRSVPKLGRLPKTKVTGAYWILLPVKRFNPLVLIAEGVGDSLTHCFDRPRRSMPQSGCFPHKVIGVLPRVLRLLPISLAELGNDLLRKMRTPKSSDHASHARCDKAGKRSDGY